MRLKQSIAQLYHKLSRQLTQKKLAIGMYAVFALSLLPILYLTVVNRASGDDYGYGAHTHAAWLTTGSLVELGKAVGQTIQQYYDGWQGTWFSIALFSLQPEVFHDGAYVIVTPLMLLLWIGSTCYLFRELLVDRIGVSKWGYRLVTLLFLFISMQFIPGKKSSLFWFNGCAHYMIPFTMCQFLAAWLLKWERTYAKRYFVGIFIFMTLLGGSNYQAALLALIAAVYVMMYDGVMKSLALSGDTKVASRMASKTASKTNSKTVFRGPKREHHILWLFLPIVAELTGLVISMLAPGNKVRGGEEMTLSVGKVLKTIGMCFVQGAKDAKLYLLDQPVVLIGMLVLFLILLKVFSEKQLVETDGGKEKQDLACDQSVMDGNCNPACGRGAESIIRRYPLIGSLLLLCLYCAMQAPALYANVEVSQGVGNTNFQVLLLSLLGIEMIAADWIVWRIEGCSIPQTEMIQNDSYSSMGVKPFKTADFMKDRENGRKWDGWDYDAILLTGLLLACVGVLICRHDIRKSTDFVCYEYIVTGQAADYKEQMDLQTELLLSDETDVVLPGINDWQGPLMHMPVTADVTKWTNTVTSQFYQKNSVVAIPRTEWMEIYGQGE